MIVKPETYKIIKSAILLIAIITCGQNSVLRYLASKFDWGTVVILQRVSLLLLSFLFVWMCQSIRLSRKSSVAVCAKLLATVMLFWFVFALIGMPYRIVWAIVERRMLSNPDLLKKIDADYQQLVRKVDSTDSRSLRTKVSVSNDVLVGMSSLGLGKVETFTMHVESGDLLLCRYEPDFLGRDATIYIGPEESLAWIKESHPLLAKTITTNIMSVIEY